VAIYQAPQAAYDYFDKVVLLYEGRCCFFGPTTEAKAYFEDMGFHCPARQTIPDFLTSLTSPGERRPRDGFEKNVPKTPDEFARVWKASPQYAALQRELDAYEKEHPMGGQDLQQFKTSVKAQKGKHTRGKSPYMLSYWDQVKLCTWRGFLRLKADPSLTATQLFGNTAMALIISSCVGMMSQCQQLTDSRRVFYNLAQTTESFFQRGAIIVSSSVENRSTTDKCSQFFAILLK
jgi:ATP-binding cassette subfamily G (WHITE) protein 2 (PDR)